MSKDELAQLGAEFHQWKANRAGCAHKDLSDALDHARALGIGKETK